MDRERVTITREEGYYRILFREVTHEAIDDWLKQVDMLLRSREPAEYIGYLITVVSDETPPLGYVIQAATRFVKQHPMRPFTRTAVLYRPQDYSLLGFLDMFLRWLTQNPRDAVRFYPYNEEHEAIVWVKRT